MDTWHWDHHGPHPSLAGAALLPAGDVAPALTGPRGTAALGPCGASSILSPAQGKVKVYQGFCWGLTGPSAFYRLFKQLTSINQSGAGSAGRGAGKAGGACWEAGERRVRRGLGAAGAWGPLGHRGHIRALRTRGLPSLTTFPHLTSITPAPSKVPGGNYNSSIYPHHSTGPGHTIALRLSRTKSRLRLSSGGLGHYPALAPCQLRPHSG